MAQVELKQINQFFDDVHVVKHVEPQSNGGKFLVLVGGAEAAKSLTLGVIDGLEESSGGLLKMNSIPVTPLLSAADLRLFAAKSSGALSSPTL